MVQEQNQQAPDTAASLCFNCSWLPEIPVSSWGLFEHCLSQEVRGRGCTIALGSEQHSCFHPCKSQALRAPTMLPQSRALLQTWIRLLGSRRMLRKTSGRWFEGSHCLLKGYQLASKQASPVSAAISVLWALLRVNAEPTLKKNFMFCPFRCYGFEGGNESEWHICQKQFRIWEGWDIVMSSEDGWKCLDDTVQAEIQANGWERLGHELWVVFWLLILS